MRQKSASAQPVKLAYSPKQAAESLGVSVFTIRRAVKAGTLASAKIGSRIVILADSLAAFLEAGRMEQLNRL